MSERRCDKCNYWQVFAHAEELGECRRRSPVTREGHKQVAYWPGTPAAFWCGKFKPAEGAMLGPPVEGVVKAGRTILGQITVACNEPAPELGDWIEMRVVKGPDQNPDPSETDRG